MTFSEALELLKQGRQLTRSGWKTARGRAGSEVSEHNARCLREGRLVIWDGQLTMLTQNDKYPVSLNEDVLADDWELCSVPSTEAGK